MMFWRKKNKESSAGSVNSPVGNIHVVVKTDLGNVRTNNEDSASFFRISDSVITNKKGYLMIVADGMGGHLAGEVASKMAVDVIREAYFKNTGTIEQSLSHAFHTANSSIFSQSTTAEAYKGMGTTCTALVILGDAIYFGHVGDSRAYLYKNEVITKITQDHTYVQELVNSGAITMEEADSHPQRNILTNAMGTKSSIRVDVGKCPLLFETNDRVLICSDGLYDYFTDKEIGEGLSGVSIEAAADHFISEAKNRGGMDNITVIIAEVAEDNQGSTLKTTREVVLPKATRDADLPVNNPNI